MNEWGACQWTDIEFLEELSFIRWCNETAMPEAVNLWILYIAERTDK